MFVTFFAGVDDIECFAIEMPSVTQNWLQISDDHKMTFGILSVYASYF